ncbi:molybdopterin-dependent oxidoreductase [Vibrio sp. SCSIO 43136]|uniref:molybdopterin-dependent oxidoreductase n=1 Tax=Vibrio sp. SCSIO 43136 TaxID=2819101 RepID=UPI0020759A1E|nr:molybdopterin-dependent oxidoreductase [Vibrio sp. SCSIO 43136]USD67748.1 molybdopterin-dependent oxidoreductase [Vibrio sp. SCSIO 43136]
MNTKRLIRVLALSIFLLFGLNSVFATAHAKKSLVIKGNVGSEVEVSLEQIKRLDQVVIDTNTPWTQGMVRFQGPLLKDVLALAQPKGDWLMLRALDQYQASASYSKIIDYQPIVAWKMDGKEMSVRKRGPYWIMFPIDEYEELKAHIFNDYMVWQLYEIEVMTKEP